MQNYDLFAVDLQQFLMRVEDFCDLVRLKIVAPSHRELSVVELPMLLEGEDRGANLVLQLGFQAEEEGVYWFDVSLHDALITKVPLRVIYQRLSISRGPGKS